MFGGGQMQGPQADPCDYCHQKPKFPPYDYCGKVCGSRAKATGGIPSNHGPVMCKQCGQRPVYKGHQFCGRNCANTWQAAYGQINTSGRGQPQHGQQQWGTMPPPHTQNPPNNPIQPLQGFNQSGGFQGFVKGLKGLVSQGQQPQSPQQPQQQPGHMQQVSGSTSMMISPPITPMSSGGSNTSDPGVGGPMPPGSFDPMSPGTPTPTSPGLNQQYYSPSSPASPGIQDPDASSQTTGQHMSPPPYQTPNTSKQNSTPGQKSKTMGMAMPNPQVNSTGGGGTQSGPDPNTDPHTYADPNQDPTATPNRYPNPSWFPGQDQNAGGPVPIQAQAQAQLSVQVTSPPTGAGGSHGNGNWNPNDPNLFPSRQLTPNSSGPSPTTCRLKGCNKSVFVDPTTYHQSDYCSHRHRQEAKVSPCIMCLKVPRGPSDHFCSKACRDKALSP